MCLLFLMLFCTQRAHRAPAPHSPLLRGTAYLKAPAERAALNVHLCCVTLLPTLWSHHSGPRHKEGPPSQPICERPTACERSGVAVLLEQEWWWIPQPVRVSWENFYNSLFRVRHLQQWKPKDAQRESWARICKGESETEWKISEIEKE